MPFPTGALVGRDVFGLCGVGVDLVGVVGVVGECSAHQSGIDVEIPGSCVNGTVMPAERRDDLVHVQPGSDHEWSTTTGRSRVESDQGMALSPDGLPEEAVDQRVPRLGPLRRCGIEQPQGPG